MNAKKLVIYLSQYLIFSALLLLAVQTKAQADTNSYNEYDSTTFNKDSNSLDEDSASMEDDIDTTGRFFNWKESASDPYTTERIKVRVSSDTTVQRLRNEDDFWYVKSIEDFKKNEVRLRTDKSYRDSLVKEGLLPADEEVFTQEPDSNAWYLQPWVSFIIWSIIVIIFLSAIIFFLASNKINIFSRKAAKAMGEETEMSEQLSGINYDQLLQKYIIEKNYRLAVRVLYLQLLKMLSDKELITFQPQFTNTNYLQQLYNTNLYSQFFKVTRHYEYIWYGEFSITENSFRKIETDFVNLKREVR